MSSEPYLPPAHRSWLADHERSLLRFGRRVVRGDGLAHWLGKDGTPEQGRGGEVYMAARMAHVHLLGAVRGVPGCGPVAARLLAGLDGPARDTIRGGWYERVPDPDLPDGPDGPDEQGDKSTYTHAFVVIAAATATVAGHPAGRQLLDDALRTTLERLSDPGSAMFVDRASADFSHVHAYRGLNANMHMVEALLAARVATGDQSLADRAACIGDVVVARAAEHDWRVPEHYDERWEPLLDHNRDRPADQFRPFGATTGHALEWSRLLVQIGHAVGESDRYLHDARRLFGRAVSDGWVGGEHPGFVYTTDWSGVPVVTDRVSWVVAEAIAAAATLWRATGERWYQRCYADWWDLVATAFVDDVHGSWHHQLDADNRPTSTMWSGKPDLYHTYQAVLLSQLPVSTSVAAAVVSGSQRC